MLKVVKIKGVKVQVDVLCNVKEEFADETLALAKHLGVGIDTISVVYNDTYESTDVSGEYLVLDDVDADALWESYLDSYIDDCLEIPEYIVPYFDEKAWKRDAKMDGRGHSLSSYDGEEYEEEIGGTTYYIYRTN